MTISNIRPAGLSRLLSLAVLLNMTLPVCGAQLPEVKVDQEHLQMQVPGSRQLIYEVHQGSGFILDTSNYAFIEMQQHAGQKKVIQVIQGRNQVLSLPYSSAQKQYIITPPSGIKAGQRLAVGIGYQIDAGTTLKFFPAWYGLVDVK